jgi:hypothetical protein
LRTEADIIAPTAWTQRHWRKKAEALAVAHCPPFWAEDPKKAQYHNAIGCPVAFVMICGKKRTSCGLRKICPFCWARDVRKQWLKIDAAFFPAAKKGRVRVVDTGHGQAESSSFTQSVKDGEIAVKSPYDLVKRILNLPLAG